MLTKIVMAMAAAALMLTIPGQADEVTSISGDYEVTHLEPGDNRFQIALPGSRDHWVRVKPDTKLVVQDRTVRYHDLWRAIHPGDTLHLHGGRDEDGTIVAYEIYK